MLRQQVQKILRNKCLEIAQLDLMSQHRAVAAAMDSRNSQINFKTLSHQELVNTVLPSTRTNLVQIASMCGNTHFLNQVQQQLQKQQQQQAAVALQSLLNAENTLGFSAHHFNYLLNNSRGGFAATSSSFNEAEEETEALLVPINNEQASSFLHLTPSSLARKVYYLPEETRFHDTMLNYFTTASNSQGKVKASQLEQQLRFCYYPDYIFTLSYLETLLTPSLSAQFTKYKQQAEEQAMSNAGDMIINGLTTFPNEQELNERVILAHVNDSIGHGLFALENFEPGQPVAIYYGEVLSSSWEPSFYLYNNCTEQNTVVDGDYYRGMAAFINHSAMPNCKTARVFKDGMVQAVFVAQRHIRKGEQFTIDYGE